MAIIGDVEPVTSREAQVCGVLYTVLREPGALPLTCRAPSATGVQLHDRFVSAVAVTELLRPPYLTPRQVYILTHLFGYDWPLRDVALTLGLTPDTVSDERFHAIQTLCRLLWNDPTYEATRPRRRWLFLRALAGRVVRRAFTTATAV
jgi:hypothetical protein